MDLECRFCKNKLEKQIIDLGHQPPSNAYLNSNQLSQNEKHYPLKLYICKSCWLVQLPAYASASELFTPDYAYFSSTSTSWCKHAKKFVDTSVSKLGLDEKSHVVEIASNDGYLLQYVRDYGIPCLGIEPTHLVAEEARRKKIKTIEEFFGRKLAQKLVSKGALLQDKVDLVIANNVIAHVPDINDFLGGINYLLKENGFLSCEFPHLLNLLKKNQFDTIYHEHYSYLSLKVFRRIAYYNGLKVVEVEEIPTHGGSLRVWLVQKNNSEKENSSVKKIIKKEEEAGLESLEIYEKFRKNIEKIKYQLLDFLVEQKKKGKRVFAYGAAAKGNTLLNYAGIKNDLIVAVADKAKSKQGKYLPGSHIPIISFEKLQEYDVDYLILLPWNLRNELKEQLKKYDLITAIPELCINESD